jgi:hypothetical protein
MHLLALDVKDRSQYVTHVAQMGESAGKSNIISADDLEAPWGCTTTVFARADGAKIEIENHKVSIDSNPTAL